MVSEIAEIGKIPEIGGFRDQVGEKPVSKPQNPEIRETGNLETGGDMSVSIHSSMQKTDEESPKEGSTIYKDFGQYAEQYIEHHIPSQISDFPHIVKNGSPSPREPENGDSMPETGDFRDLSGFRDSAFINTPIGSPQAGARNKEVDRA